MNTGHTIPELIQQGIITEELIDGIHEVISPFMLLHTEPFNGTDTLLKGLLPSGKGVDHEYDVDLSYNHSYDLNARTLTTLKEHRPQTVAHKTDPPILFTTKLILNTSDSTQIPVDLEPFLDTATNIQYHPETKRTEFSWIEDDWVSINPELHDLFTDWMEDEDSTNCYTQSRHYQFVRTNNTDYIKSRGNPSFGLKVGFLEP